MTKIQNSKLFRKFGNSNFGFVSDFDIRISDLDMTNHRFEHHLFEGAMR